MPAPKSAALGCIPLPMMIGTTRVAAMMASIGLPGFANFWGELSIFVSLASLKPFWLISLVIISIVISAIYGLRAVARVFYGAEALPEAQAVVVKDITPAERIPALLLFAALVAVGFVPSLVTDELNPALTQSFTQTAPAAVDAPVAPVSDVQ